MATSTKKIGNVTDAKTTAAPTDTKASVSENTTVKKTNPTVKDTADKLTKDSVKESPKTAEIKKTETKAEIKNTETKVDPKKVETKKAETKTETKKAPVKKAAEPKKSTTAKKAPVKKTVDVNTSYILQFSGKEIAAKDILENVKKVWVDKFQKKLEEIKTIELYIKPEENKAYFVINGLSNGDYFVEL